MFVHFFKDDRVARRTRCRRHPQFNRKHWSGILFSDWTIVRVYRCIYRSVRCSVCNEWSGSASHQITHLVNMNGNLDAARCVIVMKSFRLLSSHLFMITDNSVISFFSKTTQEHAMRRFWRKYWLRRTPVCCRDRLFSPIFVTGRTYT